jgi:septum formation protein
MPDIMKSNHVLLASASPRRQALFQFIGVSFETQPCEIDEYVLPEETPESCVIRLSRLKAQIFHGKINTKYIVGADTVIALDGQIMGKPSSRQSAIDMLQLLNNRTHHVLTGVSVVRTENGHCMSDVEITRVTFKPLTRKQIQHYVETGEPLGKAGAYAIQGKGFSLIKDWHGSFSNIVGLPLRLTQKLLHSQGCTIR